MFQLLYYLFDAIRPLLAPMAFIFAWGLIILVVWSLWSAAKDTITTAKQMHQIPCSNCVFFNNDYRLKCTVNPSIANTEEAIGCLDHQQKFTSNK
nr:hypothetical protein [Calothrix rhizosoleniae]